MTQILDNLVALLSLEPIEENLFRGMSQDLGFRQLYGGQVLGQALSAASQTVEDDRHVHSMHGYFLRPGDASMPVVYQVDRVRDGGSFSTRRVTAIQKGQPIFTLSSSFQYDEEGFHHQIEMPEVVGPDNLPSELELTRQRAERIPERIRDKLLYPKPIEIRPVTQHDPYDPQPDEP
ncbi:acyl-CoA thioesterase domain-containing protein, partial [Pseudomonas aeruginosa]